jgi:deoxyribodipyrimidine photolyase-like uncharacterized protein
MKQQAAAQQKLQEEAKQLEQDEHEQQPNLEDNIMKKYVKETKLRTESDKLGNKRHSKGLNRLLENGESLEASTELPNQASNKASSKTQGRILSANEELDDTKVKAAKIHNIMRYHSSKHFKTYLKEQGFESNKAKLEKKSITELTELLDKIKFSVSVKNSSQATNGVVLASVATLETVLHPYYACKGVSQMLSKSPEFEEIMEELNLENESFYISPKGRLLALICQSIMMANAAHSFSSVAKQQQQLSQPAQQTANQTNTQSNQQQNMQLPDSDVK